MIDNRFCPLSFSSSSPRHHPNLDYWLDSLCHWEPWTPSVRTSLSCPFSSFWSGNGRFRECGGTSPPWKWCDSPERTSAQWLDREHRVVSSFVSYLVASTSFVSTGSTFCLHWQVLSSSGLLSPECSSELLCHLRGGEIVGSDTWVFFLFTSTDTPSCGFFIIS